MEVSVTRRYRGVKDEKGNVSSNYNYGVSPKSTGGTTIINNYYTADTSEETLTAPTITLCFNFIDLIAFEFKAFEDMLFTSQESENGDATLSVALDTFIGQFETVTITPSVLGMVILKGEFKL